MCLRSFASTALLHCRAKSSRCVDADLPTNEVSALATAFCNVSPYQCGSLGFPVLSCFLPLSSVNTPRWFLICFIFFNHSLQSHWFDWFNEHSNVVRQFYALRSDPGIPGTTWHTPSAYSIADSSPAVLHTPDYFVTTNLPPLPGEVWRCTWDGYRIEWLKWNKLRWHLLSNGPSTY